MKIPSTLQNLASTLSERVAAAKIGISQLHQIEKELRASHAEQVRKRGLMAGAPPPADEIVENARRLVRQAADNWCRKHRSDAVVHLGGSLENQPKLPPFIDTHSLDAFCALAPDTVTAAFERMIRAEAIDSPGSMATRAAQLAEQDALIARLEEEHSALVDLASSFDPPLKIDLLPVVKARRDQEAAKKRRDDAHREAMARIDDQWKASKQNRQLVEHLKRG